MTTTTVFGQSILENKRRNDLHPDLHHTMSQSFLTDWEYSILNIQMSIYTGFILQCNNVTIDGASMLISKFMWLSIKLHVVCFTPPHEMVWAFSVALNGHAAILS